MTDNKERADRPEERSDQNEMSEAEIDRNLADTFPASDPPSWTLGTDHSPAPPTQESDPQDDSEAD